MILTFTGHRPNKLGGFGINHLKVAVVCELARVIKRLKPDRAISGMALGVDQWAASVCISLKIPFTAAIPFEGQELKWPPGAQDVYRELLGKAAAMVVVSRFGYSPRAMQKRNEWMVDHCDNLLAVWDGSSGGTANCIAYAETRGIPIVRIDPTELVP